MKTTYKAGDRVRLLSNAYDTPSDDKFKPGTALVVSGFWAGVPYPVYVHGPRGSGYALRLDEVEPAPEQAD